MEFIRDNLPPAFALYRAYTTAYNPYLLPIYRFYLLVQTYFFSYVYPALYPLYTLASTAFTSVLSSDPKVTGKRNSQYTQQPPSSTLSDLIPLLTLAVLIIISLRVLNYMRQTVAYLIALTFKLLFWSVVLGLGYYTYQRGFDRTMEDLGWIWGIMEGLTGEGERVGGRKAKERDWERRAMGAGAKRPKGRHGAW